MLTQANCQKLQRTGRREWNMKIFLIANLQILIHFLLPLLVSQENEILVLWLTVNNMRTQRKLLFPFYDKKYFSNKKSRRQKSMTLLINQILFSFENWKYGSFAEINMIYMITTKALLLSFDTWKMHYQASKFCNFYLLKNYPLIKRLFLLINRFCLSCVFFSLIFKSLWIQRKPTTRVLFKLL